MKNKKSSKLERINEQIKLSQRVFRRPGYIAVIVENITHSYIAFHFAKEGSVRVGQVIDYDDGSSSKILAIA